MKYQLMFTGMKRDIAAQHGKAAASRVWKRAKALYGELAAANPQIRGDGQYMVTVAAIYLALRELDGERALPLLLESGKRLGLRLSKLVHGFTSLPGVPEGLWKRMLDLMRKMSGEENGYTRRIVSETAQLVGVDILSCPLHDAAKWMGVPEAARIVCAMDREYMGGFRRIDYTRTMSLAEGAGCCDYRLAYNPEKP